MVRIDRWEVLRLANGEDVKEGQGVEWDWIGVIWLHSVTAAGSGILRGRGGGGIGAGIPMVESMRFNIDSGRPPRDRRNFSFIPALFAVLVSWISYQTRSFFQRSSLPSAHRHPTFCFPTHPPPTRISLYPSTS